MVGEEIFKEKVAVDLTEEEVLKLGKVYEVGFGQEFFQKLCQYGNRKLSQLHKELIYGDQNSLDKVYFLKGQIVGLLDIMGQPEKIIARRKQTIEERNEKAKAKKEKEKKRARG